MPAHQKKAIIMPLLAAGGMSVRLRRSHSVTPLFARRAKGEVCLIGFFISFLTTKICFLHIRAAINFTFDNEARRKI